MIDGIKIFDLKTGSDFMSNKLLSFVGHHNAKTYEVLDYNQTSKYKGIKFVARTNKTLGLEGSIHKYFNSGEHNHNDFTLENIRNTISDLKEKFSILGSSKLTNLEFGVNLKLNYSPERFIKSVINHKGEEFYPMSKKIVKRGMGIECKHDQYYIKIYDKGAQYCLDEFVLRIEIKVVRSKFFSNNRIPLRVLDDLNEERLYPYLKKQFVSVLKEILVCDISRLEEVAMNQKEELIIAKGQNPQFWTRLKPTQEDKNKAQVEAEKKRKNYYKRLEEFKKILVKYKLSEIQNEVIKKSNETWDLLSYTKPNKYKGIPDKFTRINGTNSGQIHTIYKVGICTQPEEGKKYCLATGIDISDQKPESKFVNADKVGGEVMAKRIRNRYNDRKNRVKQLYTQYDNEPTLFNMKDENLLKMSQKEKEMLFS